MTRILLIDDEPATRLVTQNRLKELGFETVVAESGAKGLLEARESPFDLFLVDSDLASGVSGFDVCRRLRHTPQTANVPVVLLSKQSSARDDRRRGYEAGCDQFLLKSDLAVLDDVLRVMLRHKGQFDELTQQLRVFEEQLRRAHDERQRLADERQRLLDERQRLLEDRQRPSDDRSRAHDGEHGGEPAQNHREATRPDGSLLVDAEGVVRHADRGARELLGSLLEGKNLGRLAPATGLEAFVRDARNDSRDGFRFDLNSRGARGGRSLCATVVPLVSNPGGTDPGLRIVLLLDASKRRNASELVRANDVAVARREIAVLRDVARVAYAPHTLIGDSEAAVAVRAKIAEAAHSSEPVLLVGEPGSGRQYAARALHYGGDAIGPFVVVHCFGLSPENLESELFGHVKGAFPEAHADRCGLLQQATHGTLFLEDIDKLPQALQPKLLRVLQEHQARRAGSDKSENVEVRIIASTEKDLSELVASGVFLDSLAQALRSVEIRIPALRERRGDVIALARHFASRFAGGRKKLEISYEAQLVLESHDWRGNVRELLATMERASQLAPGELIDVEHLPAAVRDPHRMHSDRDVVLSPRPTRVPTQGTHSAASGRENGGLHARESVPATGRRSWDIGPDEPVSLELYEKKALLRALDETGGDKLAAARLLKVGKSTLYRKLKRFDIH